MKPAISWPRRRDDGSGHGAARPHQSAGLSGTNFIPRQTIEDAMSRKRDRAGAARAQLGCGRRHSRKPGDIQFHDGVTNVFYITEGEATLVVGGQYEGGVRAGPDQVHGGKIIGGATYHVAKGDAIIPSRTAHWFMDVPKSVKYFTVRVWITPRPSKPATGRRQTSRRSSGRATSA